MIKSPLGEAWAPGWYCFVPGTFSVSLLKMGRVLMKGVQGLPLCSSLIVALEIYGIQAGFMSFALRVSDGNEISYSQLPRFSFPHKILISLFV